MTQFFESFPISEAEDGPGAPGAGRHGVLRARLARHGARLRERLSGLYGEHPRFEAWYAALIKRVLGTALERPQALWQLDLGREADPDWFRNGGVAYCAYVDKLGGTLRGVAARIPHLRTLGVSYLHLLPFLRAGTPPNDGGFAVASFDEIEPALGSREDLSALTAQLRGAGISLCSDLVLNHVAREHAWAQGALAGDVRLVDFFHWAADEAEVQRWEQDLPQVFPDTAPGNFSFVPERGAWVRTTFYPYQWDLNWRNPEVFSEIALALLRLANQGVEAFRLDSTGYLWKRQGTACLNLPQVHEIVQALRALVDVAAPGVLLKAEAIMPTRELPPYFGLGALAVVPECHLAYHSSLMAAAWAALATGDAALAGAVMEGTPTLPAGTGWLSYVRCHDDIGWNVLRPELQALGLDADAQLRAVSDFYAGTAAGSWSRGASFQTRPDRPVHGTNGMTASLAGLERAADAAEARQAVDRIVLLQSLSYFVGDLPLLYMGDEVAQGNLDPAGLAARADGDGRELQRPFLDEAALARAAEPGTDAGRVFAALCRLAQLRRAHPALLRRPLERCASDRPAVLALRRGGRALGLFNFSGAPQALDLASLAGEGSAPGWRELISGATVPRAWILPPWSGAWLLPQE